MTSESNCHQGDFHSLSAEQIDQLTRQGCSSEDFSKVQVAEGSADRVGAAPVELLGDRTDDPGVEVVVVDRAIEADCECRGQIPGAGGTRPGVARNRARQDEADGRQEPEPHAQPWSMATR